MYILLIVAFLLSRFFYRLFLHPLRNIPGPKLAAVSHFLEFYHDVIRGGKYIFEIQKMHDKYGPIVRINPQEVHISDPLFYDEIYAGGGRRREKDPAHTIISGAPYAGFSTVDHDLHRNRRSRLNNFFSKKAIVDLNPLIQKKVSFLATHLENAYKNGTVLNMHTAFVGLTADIVTNYAYGRDLGFLNDIQQNNLLFEGVQEITTNCHVFRHLPLLATALRNLPPQFMRWAAPNYAGIFDLQESIADQSKQTLLSVEDGDEKPSKPTMFSALTDPSIPPEERTLAHLQDEAFLVLGAGTETTSGILVMAMWFILSDKEVFLKLREELRGCMPTPNSSASWTQLEHLPYLTGVINESLRIGGVTMRTPRVAPTETLVYKDHVLPPGTSTSTISWIVHMNPDIFPDPKSFKPERWIEASQKGEKLTRFLIPFTRGSRACIGLNLAFAEIYTTIAALVRRFDMELYDTTEDDVRFVHDWIVPHPEKGTRSIKIKVTGLADD